MSVKKTTTSPNQVAPDTEHMRSLHSKESFTRLAKKKKPGTQKEVMLGLSLFRSFLCLLCDDYSVMHERNAWRKRKK